MFSGNQIFTAILVVVLAAAAVYTGEIVTFIMLGFVVMALNGIQTQLRNIYDLLRERRGL